MRKAMILAFLFAVLITVMFIFNGLVSSILSVDTISRYGTDYYFNNIKHLHTDDYVAVYNGKTLYGYKDKIAPDKAGKVESLVKLTDGNVVKAEGFISDADKKVTWLAASAYRGEKQVDFIIVIPETWKMKQGFVSEYINLYAGQKLIKEQKQKCLSELQSQKLLVAASGDEISDYKDNPDYKKLTLSSGSNLRDKFSGFLANLVDMIQRSTVYFYKVDNETKVERIKKQYLDKKRLDKQLTQL